MLFFSGRFLICVWVFINYRRVPVMHGKVKSPCMLYMRSTWALFFCARCLELMTCVNIYIMCFCIIYELLVIDAYKTWLLLSWKVFFL